MRTFHVASKDAADRVCAYLRAQAGERPMTVTVAEPKRLRSLAANRRYWLVLDLIASHLRPQGSGYAKEAWHEYFKQRYLKPEERVLPNGKVALVYPSTSDMAHEEFQAFAYQVEAWAAEHGVILE